MNLMVQKMREASDDTKEIFRIVQDLPDDELLCIEKQRLAVLQGRKLRKQCKEQRWLNWGNV
jgi:hypothetical protein